jgi:transposase
MLASLIETCKLNKSDAAVWLTDVLTKLVNSWPLARLVGLLPWAWPMRMPTLHLQRSGHEY